MKPRKPTAPPIRITWCRDAETWILTWPDGRWIGCRSAQEAIDEVVGRGPVRVVVEAKQEER